MEVTAPPDLATLYSMLDEEQDKAALDEVVLKAALNRVRREELQAKIDKLDEDFGVIVRDAFKLKPRGAGTLLSEATGLTRQRIDQYKRGTRT